ncbi:MAG: hypothetical protein OEZ68_05940 [Gammaproteobacteria bacterium]|nr:hypothetical protein [Gammaproteobacteria bacterium]MDH5800329.1 hypothetical protein [Gammaproteobacteria bacterium]
MRTVLLIAAYPFVTHYSVLHQNPWPAMVLLFLIAASVFGEKQKGKKLTRNGLASVAGFAVSGILLFKLMQHYEFAILFFPPVFASLGFLFIFGRTLTPNRTPLITHIALLYHGGTLDPALQRYTYHLTVAWVLLFAFLTVESLCLAFFASLDTWSLYTNGINYLFVLGLMAGDHIVRIWRFKHIKFPGFMGFLRMLKQTDFSSLYKS